MKKNENQPEERPARAAYEPPRVEESAAFETLALGCLKVGTTGGICEGSDDDPAQLS